MRIAFPLTVVLRKVLALTAVLCVGACVSTLPLRTAAEEAVDTAISAKVEDALRRDQRIYARHVYVDTTAGVVRLSGLIWSDEEYREAKQDAQSVPGVVRVTNELELVRGGIGSSR